MTPPRNAPRRRLATSPFATPEPPVAAEEPALAVDDRVLHDRYGMGLVVAVEERSVRVDFGTGVQRRVSPASITKL